MIGHRLPGFSGKTPFACLSDYEAGGEVRPGGLRAQWGQLVWLTERPARWGAFPDSLGTNYLVRAEDSSWASGAL